MPCSFINSKLVSEESIVSIVRAESNANEMIRGPGYWKDAPVPWL